jgi:hypothetical protein
MISVAENAPEHAGQSPSREWAMEPDRARIEAMLTDSAARVRAAVQGRVVEGRDMDMDFAHPILLLQLLIFHEAYHHGQVKLALKAAGLPIDDDTAGPLTWDVWRRRR